MKMESHALGKGLLFCLVATFTYNLAEGAEDPEARAYLPLSSAPAGESMVQLETRILLKLLAGYNKNLRPPTNSAIVDTLSMAVIDIYPDATESGFWKVDYVIRQEWNDPRLEYRELLGAQQNYTFLTLTTIAGFWKPDLAFENGINSFAHNVIQDNVMVRVFPDGNILFSTRITTTLRCAETRLVANGEFTCVLSVSSYGHTTDELVLKWRDQSPIAFGPILPSGLRLVSVSNRVNQIDATVTGSFPKVDAILVFQRDQCGF